MLRRGEAMTKERNPNHPKKGDRIAVDPIIVLALINAA